jgi:cold shock CspA family protein
MIGIVLRTGPKGYGFVQVTGTTKQVYFNASTLRPLWRGGLAWEDCRPGVSVEFEIGTMQDGREIAIDIRPAAKPGERPELN